MSIDEARAVAAEWRRAPDDVRAALVAALAEVDRLTADRLRWAQENASLGEEIATCREVNDKLAAEVSRLRALPALAALLAVAEAAEEVLVAAAVLEGAPGAHVGDGTFAERTGVVSAADGLRAALRALDEVKP